MDRFDPTRVIFLGGERWRDDATGMEISEAEFTARAAAKRLDLKAHIVELPYGLETIEQTHALIDYLQSNGINISRLGVVSSWQQLLRCGIVFLIESRELPTMLPVLANYTLRVHAYNLIICTLAGTGYTILSEIMTRLNIWKAGDPLARRIHSERKARDRFSWFNTHRKH